MSSDISLSEVYSSFGLDMSALENPTATSSVKGYSQKNYHISDGTLYSVLIPHQNKPATRTFRGSTPGRGRGRVRGSRIHGTTHSRKQLKFHHQALPVEYLQHYAQQQRHKQQTSESRQRSSRDQVSTLELSGPAKPETLNRVASAIAANCRKELPSNGGGRLQKRGRPRGRGRGSRAIPGFIQEVQGSMNNSQGRILVEKSLYETGDLTPSSVSTSVLPAVCKSLNTLLPSLLRISDQTEMSETTLTLPRLLNRLVDQCSTTVVLPEIWSHTESTCNTMTTEEPVSKRRTRAPTSVPEVENNVGILCNKSVPSPEPLNLCIRDGIKQNLVKEDSPTLHRSRRKCSTPRHLPPTDLSVVKPATPSDNAHSTI